jgi:hypothetical protein
VRRVVGVVAAAERGVLRRVRLPFGTSLWVELRQRAAAATARRG